MIYKVPRNDTEQFPYTQYQNINNQSHSSDHPKVRYISKYFKQTSLSHWESQVQLGTLAVTGKFFYSYVSEDIFKFSKNHSNKNRKY